MTIELPGGLSWAAAVGLRGAVSRTALCPGASAPRHRDSKAGGLGWRVAAVTDVTRLVCAGSPGRKGSRAGAPRPAWAAPGKRQVRHRLAVSARHPPGTLVGTAGLSAGRRSSPCLKNLPEARARWGPARVPTQDSGATGPSEGWDPTVGGRPGPGPVTVHAVLASSRAVPSSATWVPVPGALRGLVFPEFTGAPRSLAAPRLHFGSRGPVIDG